jgi:uncharacterized glyoxalase superfamily protein PhnB
VLADASGGSSSQRAGVNTGHAFEVDDVFATRAAWAEHNVEFTAEPSQEFYGGWAQFRDSEGNIWGLHSPVRVEAAAG